MNATGSQDPKRANRAMLIKLGVVVVVMFGFGFLLVPFYDQICKATGLRDIDVPDRVKNTQIDAGRSVRLELDANVIKLPWKFRPLTPIVTVHPGELAEVVYEVENTSEHPITGQAVPSYGPQQAAAYFRKLDCFCFSKQAFEPHETRRLPVVFVIDPKLPKDVNTITISYTFFEVEGNKS
jgi:cytochrome c oxidase assembly protein subunit 11